MPPSTDTEIDRSLVALAVLSACFRGDGRADGVPVADFLELTAIVLRAEVERPDTLQSHHATDPTAR